MADLVLDDGLVQFPLEGVDHLVELLASEGPRHRATIVSALGSLKSRARNAADRLRAVADGDPNDRTQDAAAAALIKVQAEEDGSSELAKLRQDLEAERRRVRELEQRLQAVERAEAKAP